MDVDVNILIEMDELTEYIEGVLEQEGTRYAPFEVRIDSDHAKFIEFGTNGVQSGARPMQKRTRETLSPGRSETYEKIKRWVEARRPLSFARGTESEKASVDGLAYVIYRKIMEEGIPPQPFIRPALHEVQNKLDDGTYASMGATMEDIAEDLVHIMGRLLDENLTSYGSEDLKNSISVTPLSKEEAKVAMSADPIFGGSYIPSSVWGDDYADLNGDTTRAMTRKSKIGGGLR